MFYRIKSGLGILPSKKDVIAQQELRRKKINLKHEENLKQLREMLIDTLKDNFKNIIFWDKNKFTVIISEWETQNSVSDIYKGAKMDLVVKSIIPELQSLGYDASYDISNRCLCVELINRAREGAETVTD